MPTQSFFKQILFVVTVLLFVSCDKDFNEIGANIIEQNNVAFTVDSLNSVQATWKKTGAIASNNLEINSLGILDNSVFGQTTASFVTQVQLANVSPTIGINLSQTVESVILYIPYFSKQTSVKNNDGRFTYELDSIYGTKTSKIKLNIYNNKFLLDNRNGEIGAPILDPNFPKLYYTNQNTLFNEKKGQLLYSNSSFAFSSDEIKVTTPAVGTTAETINYFEPGMRLELDKVFFEKLLFDKSKQDYDLSSNPNFEKYFKGLYFNVEKADAIGVLARMNFKKGTIVVKYKEKVLASDATVSVDKSITLNLTGNTVSLLENEPSTAINSYSSPKADRLYLRGGEGSVATIDLFDPAVDDVSYIKSTKTIDVTKGNGIPDELDYIKEKGWLINEASLTFYIDQTIMGDAPAEPTNIFLYDMNNLRILSAAVIERDGSGKGLKYKVNITDYVRGLINNDNANITLGVSVSQGILNLNFKKVKDAPIYSVWKDLSTEDKNGYFFPESSVMSPLGTVFYGTTGNDVPEAKKLKLKIYYTKPN